jgi:hypothetical protein
VAYVWDLPENYWILYILRVEVKEKSGWATYKKDLILGNLIIWKKATSLIFRRSLA